MMVPCRNCGQPVDADARTCPHCLAPDPTPRSAAAHAEARVRGRRRLALWSGVAIAGAVVIALAIALPYRATQRAREEAVRSGPGMPNAASFARSPFCARYGCVQQRRQDFGGGLTETVFSIDRDTSVTLVLDDHRYALKHASAQVRRPLAGRALAARDADGRLLTDFAHTVMADRCADADSLVLARVAGKGDASETATCGAWTVKASAAPRPGVTLDRGGN
jgi:hypothetical protein